MAPVYRISLPIMTTCGVTLALNRTDWGCLPPSFLIGNPTLYSVTNVRSSFFLILSVTKNSHLSEGSLPYFLKMSLSVAIYFWEIGHSVLMNTAMCLGAASTTVDCAEHSSGS